MIVETTFIFKDGRKQVMRSLDRLVLLQQGEVLPVEKSILKGYKVRSGNYRVNGIQRSFDSDDGLKIKYTLSRTSAKPL